MKYGGIQGVYSFFFNKMLFQMEYTLPGLLISAVKSLLCSLELQVVVV